MTGFFLETVRRSVGSPLCFADLEYLVARCGKCQADKANCSICSRLRTCQRCHVKKAWCLFNKGSDDGGSAESTSVMELLQDISSRMVHLESKVDNLAECVEDLVDDYNPDRNIKYPNDLPSKSMMAEFETS